MIIIIIIFINIFGLVGEFAIRSYIRYAYSVQML
jgi:hypothetical protein